MAHKKEKDYEVAEVDVDVWVCDFCDREYEDESKVHTFAIDPAFKFSSRRAGERLVWLNQSEGRQAVKRGTKFSSMMDGHICTKCIRDADLSTGSRVRGIVTATLSKLGL